MRQTQACLALSSRSSVLEVANTFFHLLPLVCLSRLNVGWPPEPMVRSIDRGSDYVLALCPGLCLDARHSNHFSRYINHDEHGNLQCSVSVDERRADFFAAATIRRGTLLNTHAPWEPP